MDLLLSHDRAGNSPQGRIGPALPLCAALLFGACLFSSCAPLRTLTIESDPAGAQIRLDKKLIGQTPLTLPFDHHGTRRVSLYMEGFQVWSEIVEIRAPWWAHFPLDLITDHLIPWRLTDEHRVQAILSPASGPPTVTGLDQFIRATEEVHREERRKARGEISPLESADIPKGTEDGEK